MAAQLTYFTPPPAAVNQSRDNRRAIAKSAKRDPTRVFRDDKTKAGEEVRVEVSAAESTQLIEAVMSAGFFDPREYSMVSDEVVAVISQEPPERVTRPIKLSATTIPQDLWLQTHLAAPYIARAGA